MRIKHRVRIGILLVAALLATALSLQGAAALPSGQPAAQTAPLHPQFPLLDANGANVLVSGHPVSTLQTCGACHDTAFIQGHSYHASLGMDEIGRGRAGDAGHAWDIGAGAFGRWDPLRYRALTPAGDPRFDLGTPEWVMRFGDRHVGGGPALYARDGRLLTELPPDAADPETAVLDPATGRAQAWDWAASGAVEMNCFLCHIAQPNNDARIAALRDGAFGWANTATLTGTGLVERVGDAYRWQIDAFDAAGELKPEFVLVQDPANANCGQCHGLVHTDARAPLALAGAAGESWETIAARLDASLTTGQIISAQQIKDSGLNLADKTDLSRPWDIHAARQVKCTDCHFSLNNPVYFQESAATRPEHLTFDPRRLDLGEYLERPVHNFAKGAATQATTAPELAHTMRRCEGCHDAGAAHAWLPYAERHFNTVACESCHVPHLYAPALQSVDWTALTADGEPRREYRGVEGEPLAATSLITGFQPALVSRQDVDGKNRLAPYNLVTVWYWVYDDPPRPVRQLDLEAAWFEDRPGQGGRGVYAAPVIAALDADGDGTLTETELALDTPAKQSAIAGRLAALGLANPRITGEVQPYAVSHDVTDGKWVTRECTACHGAASRLSQPFTLAAAGPTGVTPTLLARGNTRLDGDLSATAQGELRYQTTPAKQGLYVFGQTRVPLVDWIGLLVFVGTLFGIAAHGGLRILAARRRPKPEMPLKRVYIYSVYERFWHWLQTFTIVGLIFTGLIIHKPDIFGMFAFRSMVYVHNVLAAIVIVNAGLSLFYHLASGEVRQFIPRPSGFYDQAILQAKYYLQGIFKHEPHPFEKTSRRKLNPLQQITYFGLLNVLLPAQIITGALIWAAEHRPDLAQRVGGLPLLAPLHSLVAWLLATFVLMHVYLTTTGHTPLALIRAMMLGWEDVEAHGPAHDSREASTPALEASYGS